MFFQTITIFILPCPSCVGVLFSYLAILIPFRFVEGVLGRLSQMERLADRMAARASGSDGGSASLWLRLLRTIRALMAQLSRVRVKFMRRLCHAFLRTAKVVAPELQALIMYAIDYNCMHMAGATACEMVYGLKRSKIMKAQRSSQRQSGKLPNQPQAKNHNKRQ